MAVLRGGCPFCGVRGAHISDGFGFMCLDCRCDCQWIVELANMPWWKRTLLVLADWVWEKADA